MAQLLCFTLYAVGSGEWRLGTTHAVGMLLNAPLALGMLNTSALHARWREALSLAACILVMLWSQMTNFGGIVTAPEDLYIESLVSLPFHPQPHDLVWFWIHERKPLRLGAEERRGAAGWELSILC